MAAYKTRDCSHCTLVRPRCMALIKQAKEFLILRNYECTVDICTKGLDSLTFAEEHVCTSCSLQSLRIGFGALAIQALAQLGRRQDGIIFAEKWFGEAKEFPPEIMQICICLQLKFNEQKDASKLAEEWLSKETNQRKQTAYEDIAELYARYILVPQRRLEMAERFLVNNETLREERIQKMLSYIRTKHDSRSSSEEAKDAVKLNNADEYNTAPKDNKPQRAHGRTLPSFAIVKLRRAVHQLSSILQALRSVYHSKAPTSQVIKTAARLTVLACFLYLLIVRSDFPDVYTSDSGPVSLWRAVIQAWSALFAPYHLMKQ